MRTTQDFVEASDFLARLLELGGRLPDLRMHVERAYWDLLREAPANPLDRETPYLYNGAPDIEKITDALRELGSAEVPNEVADCFWDLVDFAAGFTWNEGIEDDVRTKAKGLSISALFRCAAVMAMAFRSGVWDSRRKELAAVVLEAVR